MRLVDFRHIVVNSESLWRLVCEAVRLFSFAVQERFSPFDGSKSLLQGRGEEVGVSVDRPSYFCSGPWPQPNILTLGMFAYCNGRPDLTVERSEIRNAGWFSREQLRESVAREEAQLPPDFSVGRRLVDQWLSPARV